MVKKYTWIDYGSSYGLSEINAAILYGQLKQAKKITRKRLAIFKLYHKILENLERNLPTNGPYSWSPGQACCETCAACRTETHFPGLLRPAVGPGRPDRPKTRGQINPSILPKALRGISKDPEVFVWPSGF
jgi:hypothetical protein